MRNAFADEITKLAQSDPRVYLLSGDIGNRLFNPYKEACGDRFLNCGVAEADMVGVASGLAMSGMKPVTYTITTFMTARCFEQIKLDVAYHNVPVVITSVGGGLSYASLGPTHHSFEDIGLMRLLPHMTILCPADALEVRAAIHAALAHDGPVYLRLGKKNEPLVHAEVPSFTIGKAIPLMEGTDVCLLATGNITPNAVEAAKALNEKGISAAAYSFHTVKPLDEELLRKAFDQYKLVVTLEEHSLNGGFGSAVSEWCSDNLSNPTAGLLRIGMRDEFLHEAGGQSYAREHFGLSAPQIAEGIKAKLKSME